MPLFACRFVLLFVSPVRSTAVVSNRSIIVVDDHMMGNRDRFANFCVGPERGVRGWILLSVCTVRRQLLEIKNQFTPERVPIRCLVTPCPRSSSFTIRRLEDRQLLMS